MLLVALGLSLGLIAPWLAGNSLLPAAAPARSSSLSSGAVFQTESGTFRVRKDPTLASHLAALADAATRVEAVGQRLTAATAPGAFPVELRGMIAAQRMRLTAAGEVQVWVIIDDAQAVRELAAVGARIERVDEDTQIVQAQVPTGRLRQIASLSGVRNVQLPDYPYLQAGSALTEGDAVLNSDDLRSDLGIDGAGVTVGVISDGVGGLANSQGSGDLPSVDTSTCNVTGLDPGASGAEGTAMLEIVHDIAPGASLMFGNFGFGTVLDFNTAVDCLAANADIVVDDIGWFGNGPYDGTSFVSANTADALNGTGPIRGYYTAVGNMALTHYQGDYIDSGFTQEILPDSWNLHGFVPTADTSDAGIALACACADALELEPGGLVEVSLQWSEPFGAAASDYDLFLLLDGEVVAVGGDFQGGAGDPVEQLAYLNESSETQTLDLMIGNFNNSAAPHTFDMFVLCSALDCNQLSNDALHNYNTPGSSVPSQSDAGGSPASVIAAGAVRHSSPNTIEPYSSLGRTEDGRLKPDLVAPDGVSITGAGGFSSPFFGTSAASPHVAGVAALLLQCNPSLSRVALHDLLINSVVDLGDSGPDTTYGSGRLDALIAADTCGSIPTPTVTLTAAPTPTSTPTAGPTPTQTATATAIPVAFGDASCEGDVNSIDAALVLQLDAGLIDALACEDAADVNGDGRVNSLDAALILQFDAGLLDEIGPPATPTPTITSTPSPTATAPATETPVDTPTASPGPTATATPPSSPTLTATSTVTGTPPTATPSATPGTPTATSTGTPTATPPGNGAAAVSGWHMRLFGALELLSSAGHVGGPASMGADPPVDIRGAWSISLDVTDGVGAGLQTGCSVVFEQTGADVTAVGTCTVPFYGEVPGSCTGTLDPADLTLNLTCPDIPSFGTIFVDATVSTDGNTATGTWTASNGSAGDYSAER